MARAQARSLWDPTGLRSERLDARQIAQYGPAGRDRIDPMPAGKSLPSIHKSPGPHAHRQPQAEEGEEK